MFFTFVPDSNAPNLYLRKDTLLIKLISSGGILSEEKLKKWLGHNVKHVWFYNSSAIVQFMSEKESYNILQVCYFCTAINTLEIKC